MSELAKLYLPPKRNYSLAKLKEENPAAYNVVVDTLITICEKFYEDDEDGMKLFLSHAESLIRCGMFLPDVTMEGDHFNVRFKMWSYFDNSFKFYDEMELAELDIHAAMLERFRMVN